MIDKLDVVRRHIETSIILLAMEGDAFSVHLLAHASDDMLFSIAEHRGLSLPHDYKIHVKQEHQVEFKRLVKKHYNWAKHADRDPDALYEGPDVDALGGINEMQILLNVQGYTLLAGHRTSIMSKFLSLITIKKPNLFDIDKLYSQHPQQKLLAAKAVGFSSSVFRQALRQWLLRESDLPEF
jgi:hypothetical protein